MYQTKKALAHAALVTRDGETVILVAACTEGSGDPVYKSWGRGVRSYVGIPERFWREDFRVGPHKAV